MLLRGLVRADFAQLTKKLEDRSDSVDVRLVESRRKHPTVRGLLMCPLEDNAPIGLSNRVTRGLPPMYARGRTNYLESSIFILPTCDGCRRSGGAVHEPV